MQGYFQPSAQVLSGQVVVGQLGDAAVTSGNIAPGSVGRFHVASGQFAGFELGSGAIVSGRVASGQIGSFHIASGGVLSGNIASGQLGPSHLSSPTALSGHIGSGAVVGQAGAGFFNIASGTIAANDLGSGAVNSGHMASGFTATYARNDLIDSFTAGQAISGVVAVALRGVDANGSGVLVVPAEWASGQRLPVIGVNIDNVTSGQRCRVVSKGVVLCPNSGTFASGFVGVGAYLYVGSGGLLVNFSGYMGGASSGAGPGGCAFASGLSGILVQRVALPLSGAIYVMPDSNIVSGLLSGQLGQF